MAHHGCPVCGFPGFREFHSEGGHTWDICASCGFQSGVDCIGWDRKLRDETLRARWLAAGAKWWSPAHTPPSGWDGREQLLASGLIEPEDNEEAS